MLVLSRHQDQTIIFPNLGIQVEVLRVKGKNVRLGVKAPREIRVARGELTSQDEIQCSSEIIGQLEQGLDDSASPKQRHDFKNKLNSVSLALYAAQRKLEQNASSNASSNGAQVVERYLSQAIQSLQELNALVDLIPEFDCPHRVETATAAEQEDDLTQSSGTGRKLLIVEDSDNERELLAGVLENAGYEVVAVADGQSALDHIESSGRPDVVLMDMNMPRLNGQQTISKIRSEMKDEASPIFGVSGLTQAEADLRLGESAVTGWFSKPVNPNQLVKYLDRQMAAVTS